MPGRLPLQSGGQTESVLRTMPPALRGRGVPDDPDAEAVAASDGGVGFHDHILIIVRHFFDLADSSCMPEGLQSSGQDSEQRFCPMPRATKSRNGFIISAFAFQNSEHSVPNIPQGDSSHLRRADEAGQLRRGARLRDGRGAGKDRRTDGYLQIKQL